MNLIGKPLLHEFFEIHAEAREQIKSWMAEIEAARWSTPPELKQRYPKASILDGQNVIFNLCGNKYRLWVEVHYKQQMIIVRNIGTHKEYDRWSLE